MEFNANSLILPALIFAALLGLFFLSNVMRKKLRKKHGRISEAFFRHLHTPVEILLVVTALYAVIESLQFRWTENQIIGQAYTIAAIIMVCWLAIRGMALFSAILIQKYDINRKDNIRARMVHTQVRVLRRLAIFLIVLLGTASVLMTFTEIRTLGVSLLASAGVAGIVIGLAAQKTLGNFFTGLQIAIAQPIRIDDVVIVEGEWGKIEEINLTYVVVKIWDLRRMVLPISYFVEKPFQNWTRQTADILGTVMLYVDYTMPMQPIRDELDRILTNNPLWDGKVKVVQVTDMNDRAMEIRILVSAEDSGTAFDLRCAIREGMITMIQNHFPDHLPHFRAELPGTEYKRHGAAGPDPMDPVRAPAPTLEDKPKPMNT
jgi:small-conductance mechanosensitive channel